MPTAKRSFYYGLVVLGALVSPLIFHGSFWCPDGEVRFPSLPSTPNLRKTMDINAFLLGPEEFATGCGPNRCGCNAKDCPQWYSIRAVQESATMSDAQTLAKHTANLVAAKEAARLVCTQQSNVQQTGGWCLEATGKSKGNVVYDGGKITYPILEHFPPSQRIISELSDMVRAEGITSISDFGAGLAQYKAGMLAQTFDHPLTYHAYDGAGNGPEFTKGMMEYVDLTLPLNLPITDWVISFEVGEHIPTTFEGMFVRNLHRHNRKGIILSWAIPGQPGKAHINNHSNDYLIGVFESLGYVHDVSLSNRFRNPDKNYKWFTRSLMVFRRKNPM